MSDQSISSLKRCSKCGEEKPSSADYFFRQASNKSGLNTQCKICSKQWFLDNADYVREYQKGHYAANVERERKATRDRYNSQQSQEYNQRYYAEKRNQILLQKKDYIKNNPEKARANWRNMRALRVNALGKHNHEDIGRIKENQKGKCYYCGDNPQEIHIDHVIPLVKGGSNYSYNLVVSCRPCNQKKKDKCPWIWSKRLYWITTLSFARPAIIINHMMIIGGWYHYQDTP